MTWGWRRRLFADKASALWGVLLLAALLVTASCSHPALPEAQAAKTKSDQPRSDKRSLHPPGGFAVVNGSRLWYESEGAGEPIILIAGGPGDSHAVYHPFFSRFAARDPASGRVRRLIYYDAFGVGKSDRAKRKSDYHFARDVEDLEGLRKALGLERVTLIGHSYGSMVAQAYALRHPEAVTALVLIGPFHSGAMWQANDENANREFQNQYPEVWAKLLKMRARGVRSSAAAHQDAYFGIGLGLFYFYDASKAALLPQEPGNPDVYYSIVGDDAEFTVGGDIAKLDFRPELKKLKMPALVIGGRYDRISIPRYVLEYQEYLPPAQVVFMEMSGHFPYIEEPDATETVIRDFLDQVSRSVSGF